MGKYSTKQAECVQKIETLGGDYALKWDDETQMGVNAHAALLSQFAKAGGFFDRLVETCPMRLTSNNAPEVRDLIATVMVSMVNGATRFRHFDRLHGALAEADRALRGACRDSGEPLERVHEARRRRDAPRGRHVPPAPPVVRREAVAPCAAGDRHNLHRHEREGPRNIPRHQRIPVTGLVCVAVEP